MHTLTTIFNLRLAHIATLGYPKTVAFTLPTHARPIQPVASPPALSDGRERYAHGSAIRKQLLRTNLAESTVQRMARRARNRTRYQRKLAQRNDARRAQREQLALRLYGES